MNVGILLITHGNIGSVLLQEAKNLLGACPLSTQTLSAPPDCDPEQVFSAARDAAQQLDQGDGVLVLTDLFGSTPCNIACQLEDQHDVSVVSGLNLPMLIRLLNYPNLGIDELAEKAASGARDGVLHCTRRETSNHAK